VLIALATATVPSRSMKREHKEDVNKNPSKKQEVLSEKDKQIAADRLEQYRTNELKKAIKENHAYPYDINIDLYAPLHLLALSKSLSDEDVNIAELLLMQGADPNVQSEEGCTSLHYALRATNNQQKYKYVELLLKHGALVKYDNLNFFEEFIEKLGALNIDEISSIELAIFKLLARYGGSFPLPPYPQWLSGSAIETFKKLSERVLKGPLIPAIISNDVERIKELSRTNQLVVKDDRGKGKAITDDEGVSALVYAAGQGNYEILMMLLEYPTYQRDLEGLEQALEIIGSRLSGLNETSPEYQNYQNIQTVLKEMLDEIRRKQRIGELAEPASVKFSENPLLALPIEMWYHILGYLPAATLPVFSAVSKEFRHEK
jgi:ankyrin repeat protein